MDFWCGSAAACAAVTITNPLEVIRTLFQLRHELRPGPVQPFNLLQYVQREGIWSLQRGLSAALPYQFIMNGVRLSLFDKMKREESIGGLIVAAACSGGVGAFLGSPFNLIKTRLQSQTYAFSDVGHQHNYKSVWHAFGTIVAHEGGLAGLWKGAGTSVVRTSVGSGVQLSSYDLCKRHFHTDSYVPSVCASLMTVLFMNPFDVVMTRMYNQPADARYKNIVDCFGKIVVKEGFRGLYKGFVPNYVRLGPHTILTLSFYDRLKASCS